MKIEQNILEILDRSMISGAMLTLPPGQLDRAVYVAVNKVLEAAGGKWSKKLKAHVFIVPAADVIEPILLTGEYVRTKQDFGQFDTPPAVADKVIALSEISAGMHVLEPSIGLGNIAAAVEAAGGLVTAFEVDAKRLRAAKDRCELSGGVRLLDFLLSKPEPIFDRVAMNPPFAKQADIKHVTHAALFLKPGGRLVSVMSSGVTFRSNSLTKSFRELFPGMEIEMLPPDSFKESGTVINSCIVTIDL